MSPQQLISEVTKYRWSSVFLELSHIAAILHDNGPLGQQTIRATSFALVSSALSHGGVAENRLAQNLASVINSRPVFHEAVIYFLQSLAVLYGQKDRGKDPNVAQLTYLALAANEFVSRWNDEDPQSEMTRRERNLANTVRSFQFDRGYFQPHALIRGVRMFSEPPPRDPEWKDAATWSRFQESAFDLPLERYLEQFAIPLVVQMQAWGATEGKIVAPKIDPRKWLEATSIGADQGKRFLERIAVQREACREIIYPSLGRDGLPCPPVALVRTPFVWLDQQFIAAASPWLVHEQIRGALWAKHLAASKAQDPRNGATRWFSAFGDIFDLWCRKQTRNALKRRSPRNIISVESTIGGADEFEDVVLVQGRSVVLISAKASVQPDSALKSARTPREVLSWYEKFLFATEDRRYRGGALRLLEKKVQWVREGKLPQAPKRPLIYPILVTYDRLGCDNPGIYKWVIGRCRQEQILTSCRLPKILSIDEFEEFLAVIAAGYDMASILRGATEPIWCETSLIQYIREVALKSTIDLKLPGIDAELESIFDRVSLSLFGRKTSVSDRPD